MRTAYLTAGAACADYSDPACRPLEAAMFEGLRFAHWKAEIDAEGIAILTFDRAGASVNAISRAVLDELAQIVERLSFEPPA